jgi:type IV pilus assembly protein PilY1
MKTKPTWTPKAGKLLLAAAGLLGIVIPAQAFNPLTIANEPLANATTSVQPNIMFILDDSGSMAWDYMPDYVNDSHSPSTGTPTTTAACYDNGDDNDGGGGGRIDGNQNPCVFGDPPYNSPDLNSMYYNPAIYYRPAKNADGSDMPNQDSATTGSWTSVASEAFTSTSRVNLATGYPDRVWCQSQGDAATSGTCRQNSAYRYPDAIFPYGNTSGSNGKYVQGAPYYYRMQTAQFCTSAARTTCVSGATVNPSVHTFLAPEYCTDLELTNCAAGAGVTSDHVFSGVRWCSDATALVTCQRKKIGAFIYAKHLGRVVTQTGIFAAVPNEGNINVSSVHALGGTITNIAIGGVSVISGPIAVPASSTVSSVVALITNAVNAYVSSPEYSALAAGSNVNLTKALAGAAGAGAAVTVTATTMGTRSAIGALTVNNGSSSSQEISTLTVNGVNLLCSAGADVAYGNNVTVKSDGRIQASGGTNASNERGSFRNALRDRINACAVNGYSAVISGNDVHIIAPQSLGATPNGQAVARTGTGNLNNFVVSAMGKIQGGTSTPVVATSTLNMTGGQDAFSGTRTVRIGYGSFSRIDIVPTNDAYTKAPARLDCLGATCSYAEEMTNFSNWYAYYRTRIQMMKTSVGRAFVPVDDHYRIGFITINPGNPVSSSKYLKINDFVQGAGNHRENWYAKLYGQQPSGGTPLREALSRVGWIFAGRLNTGLTSGIPTADDPIIASCQPNFAILSTDGYWNGNGGQKLDGTAMDNQDNVNAGYSTVQSGAFDGGTPVASGTLADVAMHYYKNDLRTTGPMASDNVPTTGKDSASHQHMVTFTLGLGLDGSLSYQSNYETANSGDFYNIKQGAKWPVPVADSPTALDDLWHTAVNGRGVFFSAKNPDQLADGLAETLNSLQARIGAGAAAATSNLQPVAGDNFAFVAQYQTADWIGDVTARTIDLSTGNVSNAVLWSAGTKLDASAYTSRNIYTLDPADSGGNMLKNFCWASGGTGCTDGSGLTAAEQAYFNTTLLPQSTTWGAAQLATATGESLVNFLRGDTSLQDTGQLLATDLYRDRLSTFGDIINAQPQYVRKATFSYGDTGYDQFKKCAEGTGTNCPVVQFPTPSLPRRGTVYAASNDGMLHAFETDVNANPYYQTAGINSTITSDDTFTGNNAGNGEERWAYIPGMMLPELYKLASKPYTHKYFTDGSPVIGDICLSVPCGGLNDWRTILVAGLNSGGMGYYALDITNPMAPKAMWEVQHTSTCLTDSQVSSGTFAGDCHIGLTFGNPILTKQKVDGRWVVIFASGYNNNLDGGDGRGYIYMVDAGTGKIVQRLTNDSGSAASPSGLAKINTWITNAIQDNTALAVYGGDLDGNLWRFDLDSSSAAYLSATKVAQAKDALGNPQSITVRPELGEFNSKRIIMFGTGRFLEDADKADTTSKNTIYALRDDTTVTGAGPVVSDVRSATQVKVQQFTTGVLATERRASGTAPNWTNDYGWLIDLPDPGERVNVEPKLQLGTLVVASNVPSGDTCTAGGYSWVNFLDYRDGSFVTGSTNNAASTKISSALTAGIVVVMLPGGKVVTIVTKTGVGAGAAGGGAPGTGAPLTETLPAPTEASVYTGRRVSWRELIKDR